MTDKINIRDFNQRDYPFLPDIWNANYPEYPAVLGDYTEQDKTRPEKCKHRRWVAESNGRIVAACSYTQYAYTYKAGEFSIWVGVLPEFQDIGIGRRLYDALIDGLNKLAPTRLTTSVREDKLIAIKFATDLGFVEHERGGESHLDLKQFNPAVYSDLIAKLNTEGIEFKTIKELSSEIDRDRKLYELDWKVIENEPHFKEFTRVSYEEFLTDGINFHLRPHDGFYVAIDNGKYVGMCQFVIMRGDNSLLHGLTGTIKGYRNRGIGTALKALSVTWAKENGYTKVRTVNDTINKPMLAINNKLGYIRQPDWIGYEKKL